MEKDIIQPVNISILNDMLKEQEQKYENKIKDLNNMTGIFSARLAEKLENKLKKIKELCKEPNEPYYNSECEFGKGRIDLGQEILKIIEE